MKWWMALFTALVIGSFGLIGYELHAGAPLDFDMVMLIIVTIWAAMIIVLDFNGKL